MKEEMEFWDGKICGSKHSEKTIGTKEWFDDIRKYRYKKYPFFLNTIKRIRNLKVLEIGCGIGTDGLELAKNNNYTGMDFSPKSIALAKKHFLLNGLDGKFFTMDAENLVFSDESFDIVYSCGVLHHIKDVERVVKESWRVLKKDGIMINWLYNKKSFTGRILSIFGHPEWSDGFGNPYTKLYVESDIYNLFKDFQNILLDSFGWFWYVEAIK